MNTTPLNPYIAIYIIIEYYRVCEGVVYIKIIRWSKYWGAIIKVQLFKSPKGLLNPNFAYDTGQWYILT